MGWRAGRQCCFLGWSLRSFPVARPVTTVEARYLAEESIRLLGFVVVLYLPNAFALVDGEKYCPIGEVTRHAYGFKIDFPLRIHREATAAELQRQIEFGVQ